MPDSEAKWVLARSAKVVERKGTLTVIGPRDRRVFDGDSAGLAAAVLAALRTPHTRAALISALADTFDAVTERLPVVDELLTHLRATGTVIEAVAAPPAARPLTGTRVALCATGAVATAMTPVLASQLMAAGAEVQVALTRAAQRFVSPRALEAITHRAAVTSLWQGEPSAPAPHIALAQWADVVLIAPCTARTIAKLAQGDCGSVVTAAAIATRAPVVLAPSMNPGMFDAPAVRRNLGQLRADGFHVVWPTWGHEVADAPGQRRPVLGPMLPADDLVAVVAALAPARPPTPRPDAPFWDAIYAQGTPLPWDTITPDADLVDALKGGQGTLLDLGCGLGTLAMSAHALGYRVTASDISTVALTEARRRVGAAGIAFVADDVLQSKLDGPFDVIVDRALLHTLPRATHDRYLRQLARWSKPGTRLVMKVHCDLEEARRLGTTAFDAQSLQALLQPDFAIAQCLPSSLPGTLDPPPRALCVIAQRV